MRRSTAVLIALFVAADALACTAILGVTDIPDVSDAGTGGEGGADAGRDGASGCSILYVSAATGSDGNDGCSPAKPLRSIKAAVGAVETKGKAGYTVHVCAGTYPESDLKITLAGTIYGGYNCGSWQRTAGYGYAKFDQANESIVTYASTAISKITVELSAKSTSASHLVFDGFSVRGPDGVDVATTVRLDNSTTAVVSNCSLTGADASTSTDAVAVVSGTPSLTKNKITSGAAGAAAGQSTGIHVTGGAPAITSNIVGGSGTSVGGSFGVLVSTSSALKLTLADGAPIAGNAITAGVGYPSVGIQIAGPVSVDVIGNSIQPGSAAAPNGNSVANQLVGLYANASGSAALRVVGNRIYGGGQATPASGTHVRAVEIVGATAPLVADNLIYAGYHAPVAVTLAAGGLELNDATAPVVAENTFFSGFGRASVVYDVLLSGTTSGTALKDNVFAGAGSNESGVFAADCSAIAALEHNLFVGLDDTTVSASHCLDAGSASATDIAGIATILPGATVDGNLILESPCSAGDDAGSCVTSPACAGHGMLDASPGCLSTLFPPGWPQSYGYALWQASNWAIQPDVSCQILHGGEDLSDGGFPFTADYFDAGRGPRPTIGAIESDAGASCP